LLKGTQMEIRTQDGQVMYEAEFRKLYPNTSFPQNINAETLNDFGATVILEGPQASPTRYQTAFRDGVQEIDGQWYTKYSVADMDDEAKTAKDTEQAKSVRTTRDDKLKATDWRFRSDMNPSQEWKDYCQALRDLPSATGFPWDMTWPEEPK
jgi:hypothetical protein